MMIQKKKRNIKIQKKKRNRVKIKISRTKSKERVCDIIESSSDMIDKTPSPFSKLNNENKNLYETSKNYSLSESFQNHFEHNETINHTCDIDLQTNNYNIKNEKKRKERNFKTCLTSNKKYKKESNDKTNINKDINTNNSNDKKYSKRKVADIKESEKIERITQNHVKPKREEKKDNNTNTTILNHKQQTSNLLNYFSKTPVNLVHTNMANVSTLVVKADVHIENTIRHGLYKSKLNNEILSSKKNKSEFSEIDDIQVIESENIDVSNNKEKNQNIEQQHNKHRWSLRIKLQTHKNENISDGSSDEEKIFSPKTKIVLNKEKHKNFKSSKNINLENSLKEKNKEISKQTNVHTKLKVKNDQLKNSKHNYIVNNNKCLNNSHNENKQKLINFDKHEWTLTEDKNLYKYHNSNLKNIMENEQNYDNNYKIIANNNLKRKTSDKLAPLFTKRKKPDPEIIAARRLFLQPDVIDNNNKNANKKINVHDTLPFPLISHITQSNNVLWNENNIFHIPQKVHRNYIPNINLNHFKHIIDFSKKELKTLEKINKPKVQEALIDLEKHCTNVKDMWNVISHIVKEKPKISVSATRTRKNKQLENKGTMGYKTKVDQFECYNWTYKYRPKSSCEVIGNEEAIIKLKEWLLGWKATFTNEDISSEDEFYSSDNSRSKINENNQVAILLGPYGCGKTASVYAIANEFGYTVLELNASSKRTGKRLSKELEEATKSHRIKKDERTSIFCNSVSNGIIPPKIPQNSLILIDDVDIIFEEDEGFISATYQLVSNSKRPIVMTCRDICPHLNKMAPQQNRIYFKDVLNDRVSILLELISLAESGYRLPPNCIAELLQYGDLRKAILQLQYILLSGPPRILKQTINFKDSFWRKMKYYIYKPVIKENNYKKKREKMINNEKTIGDKIMLLDIAKKLDNIALLSSLIDIEDSALNLEQIKIHSNLSLVENSAQYSASNNICSEIAEWIGNQIINKDQLFGYNEIQYQNNIMLRKQLSKGLNITLSHTTSLLLDRQIIATDYLPSVRTICRAEELRANSNNKRGNRFFHYLHNLKASSTFFKSNVLAAACKVMYDEIDNE